MSTPARRGAVRPRRRRAGLILVTLIGALLASIASAGPSGAEPDQLVVTTYSGHGTVGVSYPVNPACLKDGQAGPFDGQFTPPNAAGAVLSASGGTAPYVWSVTGGTLPPGLSLDPGTGTLSGTPVQAGTFAFTTQVLDSTAPEPMIASAPMTIAIAPAFDFAGTTTVTPSETHPLHRGPLEFTFTAGSCGFPRSGRLVIAVPGGWADPSLASADPGFVSAPAPAIVSLGTGPDATVPRFGVTGVPLAPGQSLTLTYGSAALTAPAAVGVFAFPVTSAVSDVSAAELVAGTPTVSVTDPLVSQPTAATVVVSPTSIEAGAGGPLTFVFTAGSGGLSATGQVRITVPAGWTVPSVTSGTPGFAGVSRPGAEVSVAGRAIVVTGVRLAAGQRLTISYGGTGRLAPTVAGRSLFKTNERAGRRTRTVSLASVPVSVVPVPVAAGRSSKALPVLIVGLAALLLVLMGSLLILQRHRAGQRPRGGPRVSAEPHPDPAPAVKVARPGPAGSVVVGIVPHHRAATVTVEARRS